MPHAYTVYIRIREDGADQFAKRFGIPTGDVNYMKISRFEFALADVSIEHANLQLCNRFGRVTPNVNLYKLNFLDLPGFHDLNRFIIV